MSDTTAKRLDPRAEYWRECIAEAAEECGATLTCEQVEYLADAVQGAHENYGMAFGDDVATANWHASQRRETEDLKAKLRAEQEKVTCRACDGTGKITTYGGTLMSTSQCWKCRGAGRHSP